MATYPKKNSYPPTRIVDIREIDLVVPDTTTRIIKVYRFILKIAADSQTSGFRY
jgi:hypothetical protein